MATNKNQERFCTFQVLAPQPNVTIASGAPVIFGRGSRTMAGVTVEAQNPTTNPAFDSNSGYLTVDFEGSYNLTVKATTLGSPSAGAAINPGDAIFADGGTYDPVSGLTTGIVLSVDTGGTFFGISLDKLAAGTTGTIRVILKNSPCN